MQKESAGGLSGGGGANATDVTCVGTYRLSRLGFLSPLFGPVLRNTIRDMLADFRRAIADGRSGQPGSARFVSR